MKHKLRSLKIKNSSSKKKEKAHKNSSIIFNKKFPQIKKRDFNFTNVGLFIKKNDGCCSKLINKQNLLVKQQTENLNSNNKLPLEAAKDNLKLNNNLKIIKSEKNLDCNIFRNENLDEIEEISSRIHQNIESNNQNDELKDNGIINQNKNPLEDYWTLYENKLKRYSCLYENNNEEDCDFSSLEVLKTDEIETNININDEDQTIFNLLKNLFILLEGTNQLLAIGLVKNTKKLLIAYDKFEQPVARGIILSEVFPKEDIISAIEHIFNREIIFNNYHDLRKLLQILLSNIFSHSEIYEKDLYPIGVPFHQRKENILKYLYNFIKKQEPEEKIFKELKIPKVFKHPIVVERIERFASAYNEL